MICFLEHDLRKIADSHWGGNGFCPIKRWRVPINNVGILRIICHIVVAQMENKGFCGDLSIKLDRGRRETITRRSLPERDGRTSPWASHPFYGSQKIPQQLVFHFQSAYLSFTGFDPCKWVFPWPSLRLGKIPLLAFS